MTRDSTQTQITGLTCPNCGKPITEKEIFCRYCGGSLPRPIPKVAETQQAGAGKIPIEIQPDAIARGNSASLACPSCGKSVAANDIFCRHCGGSLARLVVHQAVTKPPAQVQQSVQYKVRLHTGETKFFDSVKTFQEAILQGTITKSLVTWTINIAQDGKRKKSKESTVEKIAASNAALRSLYRPIWDYTIKFISYGAIACIGLKALDTTVTVFKVSALIGVFWLAVVGSLFLGKKWPAAPFVVIVASVMFGLKVNLFVAVLATMLVGFIFGAPLGMIVGTLVGYFRRKSRALAPDAEPEGIRPFLLGVFLPVVALAILIPVYLWLTVNMAKWVF